MSYFNNLKTKICKPNILIIDVGSGKIKASYGYKSGEKLELYGSISKRVAHQVCISESKDLKLSEECQEQSLKVFDFIQKSLNIDCTKNTTSCVGVATAWARNAGNSNDLIEKLQERGINIRVMTQDEEGYMGYNSAISALAKQNALTKNVLIWDMGGGSFQLSYESNKKIVVIDGPFGSENFKKAIQNCLNYNNPKDYSDNKFINKEELVVARKCASDLMNKYLKPNSELGNYKIYAIEAFFHLGIRPLFNKDTINLNDIKNKLEYIVNSDLKSIESEFNLTQANNTDYNLLLIESILGPLGVKEINFLDADRFTNIHDFYNQNNIVGLNSHLSD